MKGGLCLEISKFLKRIVSITLFNKGQASKIFRRVSEEGPQVVIKNNNPIAIIITPKEYELLQKLPQICTAEIDNKGFVEATEDVLKTFDEIRKMNEVFDVDV